MATKQWIGTDTAGDWNVAANWSPSGSPASADDVYITSGSENVDLNVDQSADDYASLHIGGAFAGSIVGASSAELECGAAEVHINAPDATEIRLQGGDAGKGLDEIFVRDTGTGADALHLHHGNDAITRMQLYRGTITLDGGCLVTDLYVLDRGNRLSDVGLTISDTTTAGTITNLWQRGGAITSKLATLTTVYLDDGTLLLNTDTGNDPGSQQETTLTTLYQRGGTIYHQSINTIVTVYLFGGVFTLTKAGTADARPKTITNLYLYGGLADLRTGVNNVTVTNLYERGGKILRDPT